MKIPSNITAVTAALVISLSSLVPSCFAQPASGDTAQELVAYRYLVARFGNTFLSRELHPPTTPLELQMEALGETLGSLHCDVRRRLAMSTESILVPSSDAERWLGLFKSRHTAGSWLVVIQLSETSQHVLVILSSLGPAQTTVFWLEPTEQGYGVSLLYDSFKKNTISSPKWGMMGAASGVKFENNRELLLRELVEPGSGADPCLVEWGRLFRINVSTGRMQLVSPGKTPTCKR